MIFDWGMPAFYILDGFYVLGFGFVWPSIGTSGSSPVISGSAIILRRRRR